MPVFFTSTAGASGVLGMAALFLSEPIKQDLVVGTLDHCDFVGNAPCQRLLVQRHVSPVLNLADFIGLLDQLITLRLVAFNKDLFDQFLNLRIAIISDIIIAAEALLIAAPIHVRENVP